tara:strand:+ start:217 stop:339 length:123 start_codon:yes stop_codon:yes gene_type:complete
MLNTSLLVVAVEVVLILLVEVEQVVIERRQVHQFLHKITQ